MSRICAYVIAIESIEERRSDARDLVRALNSMDIVDEASIHPAIYWKDRSSIIEFLTRYSSLTFGEGYLDACLAGQVAVSLSHISAWVRLLESPYEGALVFEDDIFITDPDRFKSLMSVLRQSDDVDWARLHLLKDFRDEISGIGKDLPLVDDIQPWGFAGYYVSREGAEKLLGFCYNIARPIDWLPPALRKSGILRCKSATEVVVDHHPFEGDTAAISDRHRREMKAQKLQKAASTIYSSPKLSDDWALRGLLSRLTNLLQLRRDGVTVLRGVFGKDVIASARRSVLDNRHLFRNTRSTPSSRHLAGFHRFPSLEPLHAVMTSNPIIREFVDLAVAGENVRSIGLSDITINRSQDWHVDLLRGKYKHHLDGAAIWGSTGGGVYKVFLYLNDTNSLQVAIGSHLRPVSLDDDRFAIPGEKAEVISPSISAGDVVIMDIRCSHRGADEEAYASGKWDHDPSILISTALGGENRQLTSAMEIGNFFRLTDWWKRHGAPAPLPQRRMSLSPISD